VAPLEDRAAGAGTPGGRAGDALTVGTARRENHAAPLRQTLAEAALAYAARGWPVFPLRPRDKVPLIPKARGGNGVHDATCDRARIEAWWRQHPDANIGLACGVAFWVLDVDYKGFTAEHDGLDSLHELITRYGPLPRTLRAQTGSGGWHYLFAPDPRPTSAADLLPGLDTRSIGGYIAASPSVHPCGASYRWIEPPDQVPIATAPEWLLAIVEPLEDERPAVPPRPIRAGDLSRYAAAALENAASRIERAAVGYQCDTLDRESYGIGRLVGGGIIPLPEAQAALVAAGSRMPSATGRNEKTHKPYRPWTRREIAWRVDRALAAGLRSPRTLEYRR
jgi:hypothetical protein